MLTSTTQPAAVFEIYIIGACAGYIVTTGPVRDPRAAAGMWVMSEDRSLDDSQGQLGVKGRTNSTDTGTITAAHGEKREGSEIDTGYNRRATLLSSSCRSVYPRV